MKLGTVVNALPSLRKLASEDMSLKVLYKAHKLCENDEFVDWLLTLIFDGFKIDVSYLTDEEYAACLDSLFNKLEYREIPKELLTGEKWMPKSVNIGDQLSQITGIYYPYPIDNYIKYVCGEKFYGRYSDDWYVMSPSKERLEDILTGVIKIAESRGIHINKKKTRIVRIDKPFKFLQIEYTLTDDGKIHKKMNPTKVSAMRRKLRKLAIKVSSCEVEYVQIENMFKSWMGGFYKLMSKTQRKNMLTLYEDLFDKNITVNNKKLIITDKVE